MTSSALPVLQPSVSLYPLGLPEDMPVASANAPGTQSGPVEISGASLSGMSVAFDAAVQVDTGSVILPEASSASTALPAASTGSTTADAPQDQPAEQFISASEAWVGEVEATGPVYQGGTSITTKVQLGAWERQDSTGVISVNPNEPAVAEATDVVTLKPVINLDAVDLATLDLQVSQVDPRINELWGLNNTGQTGGTPDADIDAFEAWDLATGDGVVVAVIDTGVDLDHEDLAANLWTNTAEQPGNGIDDDGNGFIDDVHGYDFANNDGNPDDDDSHGTHVAGTIAAVRDNGTGVVGVAYDAQIMAIKTLDEDGRGSFTDVADGVRYAVDNGADIINLSLGGGFNSTELADAIAYAGENDVLVVAAAGNNASNNDAFPNFPSNLPGDHVIAVASTTDNDQISSFSNFGLLSVDVAAPGSFILSTTPDDQYQAFSGTSMATPHIAGLAALLKEFYPDYTADQLRATILNSADQADQFAGAFQSEGRATAFGALTTEETPEWEEPEIEDDFGNDENSEGTLSIGGFVQGNLETLGDTDWFAIELVAGAEYALQLRGSPSGGGSLSDPLVRLANEDGDLLASNDDFGESYDSLLLFTPEETGTYFAVADSFNSAGVGTYTIEISEADGLNDDFAGDTSTEGRITVGGSETGVLTISDEDWFRVTLREGEQVNIALRGSPSGGGSLIDPVLSLHDANGSLIAENDDGGLGFDSLLTYTADETGIFFIGARAFGPWQTGSYTVEVSLDNDAPVAEDGEFATNFNAELEGNLADLVTDDGDDLSFSLLDDVDNGELDLNDNGSFDYTPGINFSGEDTFRYRVEDRQGLTDTGTVTINVSSDGDAVPVATNGEFDGVEDSTFTDTLAGLVTDANGDTITFSLFGAPTHGSVEINEDGSFTYEPDDDFSGQDVFRYAATDGNFTVFGFVFMSIEGVNDAPVANDDAFSMEEDKELSASLAGNDTDIDGPSLTWSLDSTPANGTVEINDNGSFTYVPQPNFVGQDSFVYRVSDGSLTDTATVTVTVSEVNDTPTPSPDSYAGVEDSDPVTGNVLDNDSDEEGDALSASIVSPANNGTVILNEDGNFIYTPDADFAGTDQFIYAVSDGESSATATVTITIANTPDAPEAFDDAFRAQEARLLEANVGDNDIDPDPDAVLTFTQLSGVSHGQLNFSSDGSFTYLNTPDYRGTDTFSYRVSDGTSSDTATVTLTVTDANDAPIVEGENFTINEDQTLTGNVLSNDSDPNGDDLSVTLLQSPGHGALSLRADGRFTYTPDANFSGADSFTYRVSDGDMTDTATVSITINAVEDAPTADPASFTAVEDTVFLDTLAGLAEDVEGAELTFSLADQASNGEVRIDADGAFAYIPDADFFGQDSFVYRVSDGQLTETATITLNVTGVQDRPQAFGDVFTGTEDQRLRGNVLDNDQDPDTDQTLTVSVAEGPEHGELELTADGRVFYDPDANFSGVDSFTYTLTDGINTTQADVVLRIEGVNDAPDAANDTIATEEDTRLIGDLSELGTDVDGDDLTFALGSDAQHGSVSIDEGGRFIYTPDDDYFGLDRFTYTLSDGQLTSTGTIRLSIANANDAPVVLDESFETPESEPLEGNVSSNDSDVDGDALTYQLLRDAEHGTLVLNTDGSFTYTPNGEFQGTDVFTYGVDDGEATVVGRVDILVTAPADDPSSDQQGETPETAGEIGVDESRAARLNFSGDRDWFALNVSAGGKYLIEVLGVSSGGGSLLDPTVALYDADGFLLDADDDSGTGFDPELLFIAEDTETLYIEVSEFSADDPGGYTLQVTGSDWEGTNRADTFRAGARADELRGLNGRDDLFGGDGNDLIIGGNGRDDLFGERGDDELRGNKGKDKLVGGSGDDVLAGGGNNDVLRGGGGDDQLIGHNGRDTLLGGDGDDLLIGGRHKDTLNGGDGADIFRFAAEDHSSSSRRRGRDEIEDFDASEGDMIDLSSLSGSRGFEIVNRATGSAGDIWLAAGRMRIDLDGDGRADMQIALPGVDALDADWLIL